MTQTLEERFQFDGEQDLELLVAEFKANQIAKLDAGLQRHNSIARQRPPEFMNHGPVLAFSVGGSNTKVMLAETRDGRFVVHRVRTMPNPTSPTPLNDYLDALILGDEVFKTYLQESDHPCLGFSIAVGITDGVPHHATKIPGITGFVARDLERDAATHHFGKNMEAWLKEHGLGPALVYYQGDAVIAHVGGVATTELSPDEDSLLLVCGNGLACSNKNHFVLCGTNTIVPDDGALYKASEMEGGQYQYLVAGKGVWGLMRRAITLKAEESDSKLKDVDLDHWFQSDVQTRRVYEIWESGIEDGKMKPGAQEVLDAVGPDAFAELQWIAARIADRAANVLANCVIATIADMGISADDTPPVLFTEGSIALNPPMRRRVESLIRERSANKTLFEKMGIIQPAVPVFDRAHREPTEADGVTDEEAAKVELTLMGTASMVIAENIMRS